MRTEKLMAAFMSMITSGMLIMGMSLGGLLVGAFIGGGMVALGYGASFATTVGLLFWALSVVCGVLLGFARIVEAYREA